MDHSEFVWSELEDEGGYSRVPERMSLLRHTPTGYFFQFRNARVRVSPSVDLKVELKAVSTFNDKRNYVELWLRLVHREHTAPDLWASVAQEKSLSRAVSSVSLGNIPFTPAEQKAIEIKLDEIKTFLIEQQAFNQEQLATIEQEVSYLKEASNRLGRKDWLTILLGGLFGLALTLSVTPETARGLISLAREAFE